jgi:hypothetical protein
MGLTSLADFYLWANLVTFASGRRQTTGGMVGGVSLGRSQRGGQR